MPTSTDPLIDPSEVEQCFVDCLHTDDEDYSDAPIVEGIMSNVAFHPGRIAEHADDIDGWLDALPLPFHTTGVGGGGGWSFLNACQDRNDRQWTGLHQTMEHLFLLGMARGRVACILPREMWSVMPGGMPYYVVNEKPVTT